MFVMLSSQEYEEIKEVEIDEDIEDDIEDSIDEDSEE